jgi:hypothetical protein
LIAHGQPHPRVPVHVTVGHVVNDLADRPTARTVLLAEIGFREPLHRGAQAGRRALDVVNQRRARLIVEWQLRRLLIFADGIAEIL